MSPERLHFVAKIRYGSTMRTWLTSVVLCASCALPSVSRLPTNFHWGVATSGFQSEGAPPDSNWSRYVKASGYEPVGSSVDFFHRFEDDVALASSLGVNTFRFSIEWARVMPRRGVVDEAALAHYDSLFEAIAAHRMTPMPTLLHFVVPGWVHDAGGLTSATLLEDFDQFVKLIAARYRGRGAWWIVLNEPTHFLTLERRHGACPDEAVDDAKARLVELHRRAYRTLHEADANARVSSNVVWEPAPASWFDDWFFDRVTASIDFVALDYYYSLAPDLSVVHAARGHYWKVRFTPEALLTAIRDYHSRAPTLPVYVVENGMATDEGRPRRDGMTRSQHLRDHLYWLQRARDEGIDVVGFNLWSLTDNYEWGDYRNRFGLFTVDVRTDPLLRRKPTEAVETFRRVIRQRGVEEDFVPSR